MIQLPTERERLSVKAGVSSRTSIAGGRFVAQAKSSGMAQNSPKSPNQSLTSHHALALPLGFTLAWSLLYSTRPSWD